MLNNHCNKHTIEMKKLAASSTTCNIIKNKYGISVLVAAKTQFEIHQTRSTRKNNKQQQQMWRNTLGNMTNSET